MTVSLPNFLHSLARDLVARAAALSPAVTIGYASAPRGLFRGRIVTNDAADDVATALRITGGPGAPTDPQPRISLQFWTVGSTIEIALNRAQLFFELLLDSDGLAARMRTIDGYLASGNGNTADGHWTIVSIDPLQRPGHLGQDGSGREQVSFNADIGFFKKD